MISNPTLIFIIAKHVIEFLLSHVTQSLFFCISFISLSRVSFLFSLSWLFLRRTFLDRNRTFSQIFTSEEIILVNCSFNCHCLFWSKCKWDNIHIFLKIIFIYFLLLSRVLNTKIWLSKLDTRPMFHWKAIFILSLLYLCSLLLLHGDIRLNTGPRNSKNHLPSFGHWNLNRLPAHNVARMLLLKTYNAIYKYDFTYFYETYLDSSILSEHVSLDLESYKLVQADHPNNVKRGGVCI